MTRRTLATFADCAVAVDAVGQAAADIVDFVLGDVATTRDVAPVATFVVTPVTGGDRLRLTCDGIVLNADDTARAIGAHLVCDVARCFAEHASAGLVLHAAAVAWGDHAVVMPGESGAGKTTLCAHLVQQGAQYLTDELVHVPADGTPVEGFSRPLSLKPGAWPTLEQALIRESDTSAVLSIVDGFLVRSGRLQPRLPRSQASLRACVFPRRVPGAAPALRRLTKAEAGLALLANLVNARNLPGHGLTQVTEVARTIPAYAAVYDDAAAMVPLVRALL